MIDRKNLRELALKCEKNDWVDKYSIFDDDTFTSAELEFVSSTSPETILELLHLLDDLEKKLEEHEKTKKD